MRLSAGVSSAARATLAAVIAGLTLAAVAAPASDTLDVTATNIATASINVSRAHVDCAVHVNVTTDGPITIDLTGCDRTIQAG